MQCKQLDIDVNIDLLKNIMKPYCDKLLEIAELFPNDVIRIMTNYPSGLDHYTKNKRKDETWEIFETTEYTLYTRITNYDTRMISVYYNEVKTFDEYIQNIIKKIQIIDKIENNKTPVVALVYAGPKFRLEKHVDSKGLVRYHLPIFISNNSYFETFEPYEKHYPKPGELWRLETHRLHTAQNDDEQNYRIHCIIDFL